MNNLNAKTCKRLVAISLITTLSYAQIAPTKYEKLNMAPISNELIFKNNESVKYSINGVNYTVTRKTDGSMTVIEESSKGINYLVMDNKGNVNVSIKNGLTKTKEKFKINNFDGRNLEITSESIKNEGFAASVVKLEKYFDSLGLDRVISGNATINTNPNSQLFNKLVVARKDYDTVKTVLVRDLKANNIALNEPIALEKKGIISNNTVYANPEMAQTVNTVGIAVGSSSPFLSSLIVSGGTVAASGVLLTTGLIIGAVALGCVIYENEIYWAETEENNLICEANGIKFKPLSVEDAKAMGFSDVRDVVKGIARNLEDENPNNDYFKAYMVTNGIVVIDFKNPLSKVEAQGVISNMATPHENIYTMTPQYASDLIQSTGGTPGTSNGRYEYIGRAENHAFKQSYKAFDPNTQQVDRTKLVANDKTGIYYWHFHYNGKQMKNGLPNEKHAWFGAPEVGRRR